MTLRELMAEVQHLPPETLICAAEIEEAFGINVAAVEFIENARIESRKPDGREAVELGNGSDKVLVIRW